MTDSKLGVTQIKGHTLVKFISETKAGYDVTLEICDPKVLHETLIDRRAKGRNIRLPDHPTEKSPRGYPVMCFGKAHGCSRCIGCIMDYYKEEVEASK